MPGDALITPTDRGLYCARGGFYIDPWKPADRAVVTHAHADHLCPTSRHILCSKEGERVTRVRASDNATIETLGFGDRISIGSVAVSLHPAGHIRGSAQIRVEHENQTWVVSGDYKLAEQRDDPTATPFEPVPCDRFITESTFGLPIFRWRPPLEVMREVIDWWQACAGDQRNAVIFTYALGKAQRILAMLHALAGDNLPGPILLHGAMVPLTEAYEADGIPLPQWERVTVESAKKNKGKALILAPPSAGGTPWIRKLRPLSDASISGWAQVRGTRRRRAIDRGFVISDHADWPSLHRAINETGATSIGVTHGSVNPMVRFLSEQGHNADIVPTRYEGERDEAMPGGEVTAEDTETAEKKEVISDQ